MFSYSKLINTIIFAIIATVMIGCSGESVDEGSALLTCDAPLVVNSAGDACVEPVAFACTLPTVPNAFNDGCEVAFDPSQPMPSVFPDENEAILYYNRANRGATNEPNDPQYNGYVLHTWNDDICNSYAAPFDSSSWGSEQVIAGIDPNYGAYWIIPLIEGHSNCGNFIIHVGTDDAGKEMGGANKQMNLIQDDETFTRMNFTISGYPDLLEFPITDLGPQPLDIEDATAHWIDANTFVWNLTTQELESLAVARLHHSVIAGIEADLDNQVNGTAIVLTLAEQTEAQQAAYPLTASWSAFTIDATVEQVKSIVKNELVLAAYNDDGAFLATHVQAAKVLDDLYTSGEADADEATMGVVYGGDAVTANLWAPTAQNVMLNVYDSNKDLVSANQMTEDPATGIWSFAGDASLDRQFFKYELTLYHSQNNAIETIESTDPYSVSLSTNGLYSQFVNLAEDSEDLKPDGWDGHTVPTIVDPEDAVIYEGHIRDFSVRDESTTEENRGKYLAFTENGSTPMTHLTELVASGLTHFHMLPANDIATVNEEASEAINLGSTVAELCEVNETAPVCGVASDSDTLQTVLESYQPASEDAQALVDSMRGFDSFNWGYDPKHFNVPEGSYSSDADGVARIKEMRAMNKALHEIGLRVVLDVVYNHTNSSGLWDNSVLDKVVPGYYHRRDLVTGVVQNSTCCDDTELDHRMMDKFMVDSLVQWTTQYGFDGFRFDIMSQGSKDQMVAAREAVRTVDADNYFYGEGWYKDNGRTAVQANQENMAGTEISTFNDRLRDSVRDATLFSGDSESIARHDIVRLGMAGTLADYVLKSSSGAASTGSSFNPSAYAADPADVINYVSKHDDPSLWDQLQFNLPFETPLEDRVRSANIAAAIPLMSQGIPFLQIGGDMLRSKSMDRNSFDSGDWFNLVDFTMTTNNWNVGLPLANDNQNRWYTDPDSSDLSISALANSPLTQVAMSDIALASSVFKEFLSIRRDSKLFRLTTADDVIARVGFHNIGSNQTQGVIVMSIDDGLELVDLDPANDAIVVMINGTNGEQSHTVLTATGFELHATQVASADGRVTGASFAEGEGEGTFTVPAKTMAVFVKTQGTEQGEGLSAYATSGAPDVVPYGDTTVFLRGDMNGWGAVDAFEYKGNGVYQVAVALTAATDYNFKIASEDWSSVDFGSDTAAVTEGEDKPLSRGAGNLLFTPGLDAIYVFEINAFDPEAPILHVRNEEPFVGTIVYLRGSLNDWSIDTPMTYIGGGQYSVVFNIAVAGSQEFKIASEDWSTVDFGSGEDDAGVTEGVLEALTVSGANMTMDFLETGEFTFFFDASDLSAPTLGVHKTQMFGTTQIYLRGSLNGWGIDDELVYLGNSVYQADIALIAGSYEFKVASEDWSSVDFGTTGGEEMVTISGEKTLAPVGANMTIEIVDDGTYRFELSGPDSTAPTLIVSPLVR
jgi:pullulanase